MDARKLRSMTAVLGVVAIVVSVAWIKERGAARATAPEGGAAASETERPLPRLVDVGAGTCKACRDMEPILAELKEEFDGRAVVEVIDIRDDFEAMKDYDVRLIPTQIFFDREGRDVWRHEGFLAKAEIVARLEELEREP